MKAALFKKVNEPLSVESVSDPVVRPNEALVKVYACGVCHTDLHYTDHGVPTFKKPPMVLGHEISGTIDRLGADVQKLTVGQKVLVPSVLSCGRCEYCVSGRSNICDRMLMPGNHIDGGFAEFMSVPAEQLILLPETFPLDQASTIADAVSTAYHAVINRGQVKPGSTVAVFGCGGVGVNVVQWAAFCGASVIAFDTDPKKLELARKVGAESVFAPEPDKLKKLKASRQITFECVGRPAVMQSAHAVTKRGGRLVQVGYSEAPTEIQMAKIMFWEQDYIGSLGCPLNDYARIVDIVSRKKFDISFLVTASYPLAEINNAFNALREGKGLRNVVLVQE